MYQDLQVILNFQYMGSSTKLTEFEQGQSHQSLVNTYPLPFNPIAGLGVFTHYMQHIFFSLRTSVYM